MTENKPKLTVIDGETLMDTRLEPTKFCIGTLLPQGITILGGAPKIGKSWWVLDICIRNRQRRKRVGYANHQRHNAVSLLGGYAQACARATVFNHR